MSQLCTSVVKNSPLCFQMHIVHIKEPYRSLVNAQRDMAGIALLAFLFEVQCCKIIRFTLIAKSYYVYYLCSQETADDHPHLDTVIEALDRVRNNGMMFKMKVKLKKSVEPLGFIKATLSYRQRGFLLQNNKDVIRLTLFSVYEHLFHKVGAVVVVAWT